ncbi:hypothetical protein GN244_ATG07881 [Phytophthora infestans]|uniref:Uncharacterized protein n=1 Tax=Phytophthora infestans TaxID=4787 RepID=A0A833WKU0_PHYIN|nr:hypothetical protein GN244_ATG07881 [Phytophthora infestans]
MVSSFSHKGWHSANFLLLIIYGFLVSLFIPCAVNELGDIYEEFGVLYHYTRSHCATTVADQRTLCYFEVSVDSHTLSDVVEKFSEVTRLRSEFATMLLFHIHQQEFDILDFREELSDRDRFNYVVKILFELKGTTVAYSQLASRKWGTY